MKLLKFAENLRAALIERELTQKDLAEQVGTTQQTVSRWLKGINEPDLTVLLEICLYLGETPNALLGYDDISEQDFLAYQQDTDTIEESRLRLITATYEANYNDESDD